MVITVERYLKVVYPIWSKKKLHRWMLYSAVAFSCISAIIQVFAMTFTTTDVIDGVCYGYVFWQSRAAQITYRI